MNKADRGYMFYNDYLNNSRKKKLERRIASMDHHIRVGDWVWVSRPSFRTKDVSEDYRVKVVCITKYFITLQYPAGFKESVQWVDFEKMRISEN